MLRTYVTRVPNPSSGTNNTKIVAIAEPVAASKPVGYTVLDIIENRTRGTHVRVK